MTIYTHGQNRRKSPEARENSRKFLSDALLYEFLSTYTHTLPFEFHAVGEWPRNHELSMSITQSSHQTNLAHDHAQLKAKTTQEVQNERDRANARERGGEGWGYPFGCACLQGLGRRAPEFMAWDCIAAEVGAHLLRSDGWGQPETEVVGVRHHHRPDQSRRHTPRGRPHQLSLCGRGA